MKNKQKKRNTKSFKKQLRKKNLQVQKNQINQLTWELKNLSEEINPPNNSEIKYHPNTENFSNFISHMNKSLCMEGFNFSPSQGELSDNRTTKRKDGKIVFDETIRSISFSFSSEEFYLHFVPYYNEVHLNIIKINPYFQKNGLGKRLMNKIIEVSNLLNINISLVPVSIGGVVPIEKLENFYSKCGFVLDNKTFHWIYESKKCNVFNLNERIEYRMVG
jgi:hypothetical protein